jgi:hypothetical protein
VCRERNMNEEEEKEGKHETNMQKCSDLSLYVYR